MNTLIKVAYQNSTITISGDIHIFNDPRLKIWLRQFDNVESNDNQLLIRDKSFTNERLNTFKKSLEHKFDYVKIDYDNNFLSEVDAFIKEEENFEEIL